MFSRRTRLTKPALAGPSLKTRPTAGRSALLDLYNSTSGPGWIDSTGWNGPPGTECTWFGVLCFDDSVWQLALPSNNLSGLSSATTYYLVVRTTTFPQPWNPNTVVSELSAEVSGTTQSGGGVRTVGIDIKPGSFPNSIQLKSKGKVPVAVLSDSGFDARQVIPSTVTLAGAPVASTPQGKRMASFADVNGDGRLDLVLHFATQALQLAPGAQEAVLEGQTFAAEPIRGVDSVRLVP